MVPISFSYAAHLYQQNQTFGEHARPNGTNSQQSTLIVPPQAQQEDNVTLSRGNQPSTDQDRNSPPQDRNSLNADNEVLTNQELQEIQKLKTRDAEVRTHEQAHLSSAGQYATGGPSFTYQKGPDGNRYAVGGEVPIDVSKESSPEATITKMRIIRRAALAPADPSAADRQIAAQAAITEGRAVLEKQHDLATDSVENGQVDPATPPSSQEESVSQSRHNRSSENTSVAPAEETISITRRQMMITTYQAIAALP